jgi:hypothetical protein
MSPAELDIVLNGAFICERPDGTRYAVWSRPPEWARVTFTRSGPLSEADLQTPASEVLAALNAKLAA